MEAGKKRADNFEVDLSNCDREPIHALGLVQSHGVILTLSEPELKVTQVSKNCQSHFGKSADELLDSHISVALDRDYIEYMYDQILAQDIEDNPIYLNATDINGKRFEVSTHRHQDVLFLEFENPPADTEKSNINLYNTLHRKLDVLSKTDSVASFCEETAEAVREFTGFDRVMVYRFNEDDSGQVIGEAHRDDLESYLGLNYPASDIPEQARELYKKQTLRFKVDVDENPSEITPLRNPQTSRPLDMSFAVLRAMSPIHMEYLRNMGVAASMSISIVKDDRLWGLIACHHNSPKYISHAERMSVEFLAHTISLQIESKNAAQNQDEVRRLQDMSNHIVKTLADDPEIVDCLIDGKRSNLLKTVQCDGAALVWDDEIHLLGETPVEADVKKLIEWLWKTHSEEKIYSTDNLPGEFLAAEAFQDKASGILVISLSNKTPEYVIWFRKEYIHTVSWGGNPEKPVSTGKFGKRLTPRESFEEWKENVSGYSKPWKDFELEFAETLRHSIVEIILSRVDELRELNLQLETSNAELDSFAYIASHDLKEPLRGISNYSTFMIEDYSDNLDQEGIERLKTVIRISDRMEELLDSLLHFSQVGRTDLVKRKTDMNKVIAHALEFLTARIDDSDVKIKVADNLPTIMADEIRVSEVFTNLISNALKYNDKDDAVIEIGYLENILHNIADEEKTEQLFFVRDNGIGIEDRHHANIFRIFKRLHGRSEYGGGVGAGLTIVKKIIDRHDGRIWLESTPGEGTTFYFTFA